MSPLEYAVVVPVKPPAVGKSRLVGLPDETRRELAAAFALDTVAACLSTPGVAAVMAVTDDARFARRLADTGCSVMPDGPSGDLNASLRLAAAEAVRRWPVLHPVALCADLPALTPADLASALSTITATGPWFVADAAGTGTTMYAAPLAEFDPRFGPGSRSAHLATGAREIEGTLATLRQDVDDRDDLERARILGLGPHTAALAGRPDMQ
jgi:2-phospho-L-lactate/phosphoenolpyruvate guanylyltransferase